MAKKSKAEAVIELLKAGIPVKRIKARIAVSESYIYMLKKKLAEGVEEVVDTVRQTAAEHTDKIKEMFADGKAQSKTTILSMTPEFAFSVSQGRQKRKEIEEAELKEMIGGWRAEAEEDWRAEGEADTDVDVILDERAATYGSFEDVAGCAQEIKNAIRICNNSELDDDQIEALDMIASKIARIVNGNPNHIDSWIDIAGYATLVADRLQGKTR